MNRWDCEAPGCSVSAAGTGGAIGLRAIGWWFVAPGPLLCPTHRPDPIPCRHHQRHPAGRPAPECRSCAGDVEAERWQAVIRNGA